MNVLVSIQKKIFNFWSMPCVLNSKNRCVITHYIKCYDSHSSNIIHLLLFYFGSLITHASKIIHLFDFQIVHANRFVAEPQGMWIYQWCWHHGDYIIFLEIRKQSFHKNLSREITQKIGYKNCTYRIKMHKSSLYILTYYTA